MGQRTVLFLTNPRFDEELIRFKNIFRLRKHVLTIGVPGNHDIGFGDAGIF
jgi:hypothetical protein